MASQTTYILKQSDENGQQRRVVWLLLLVVIPILFGFFVWLCWPMLDAQGLKVRQNWFYTVINSIVPKLDQKTTVHRVITDKGSSNSESPGDAIVRISESSESKRAAMTKQLFGIVQQPSNGGPGRGLEGVRVFCVCNGIRLESYTDNMGNYGLTIPWDGSTGIDCKIQLFYQKDTGPVRSQTVTCDQGYVPAIELH